MSNHNITPQPVPSSPQQYQPQQPQPQPPQPQHLHTTICGIAAVVFGALGLVLSFIPIVNNIAAILGFIGVILALNYCINQENSGAIDSGLNPAALAPKAVETAPKAGEAVPAANAKPATPAAATAPTVPANSATATPAAPNPEK